MASAPSVTSGPQKAAGVPAMLHPLPRQQEGSCGKRGKEGRDSTCQLFNKDVCKKGDMYVV